MTSPVIVGYDGRDPSHDALALGAALAQASKPLITACICEADGLSTATDTQLTRERHVQLESLRSEVLARRPTPDGAPRAEMLLVPAQNPAAGLHGVAQDRGCAALVVGSTHHGPIGRVVLGSTSGRLLNAGRCAVAVAPRGWAVGEIAIKTVGVGFDGSRASSVALQAGLDLASGLGARLVALTAGDSPATHLDALSVPSGDEIELVTLEGRAARALARAAADVDLLVVGSRAGRHALGSVSHELAHHCPAPLLVAPETAQQQISEQPFVLD